jgi:drug/metabolite transporter (DMT)-like permease
MHNPKHVRACVWLLIATGFWGLSFPFIRSTWLLQRQLVPEISSVFFAAALAVVRFSVAGIIIGLFAVRTLRQLTRLELQQGIGLGVFGGLGIVFQMDGLAHTSASTSAFLTQFYCLVIPVWVLCQKRVAPKLAVIISSIMVLVGVAILAQFDWREFQMGRGEAETILAAVFFAGQILWLERPRYTPNRVTHFTVVMFATIAVLIAPVAVFTAPSAEAFVAAYAPVEVLALVAGIVFICTLAAYMMMNVWQPHVTATEAGLIYCVEPVCASVFAAFLPGWISKFANIDYANEHLTSNLIIGGALITAANVLIQLEAMRQRRKASAISSR